VPRGAAGCARHPPTFGALSRAPTRSPARPARPARWLVGLVSAAAHHQRARQCCAASPPPLQLPPPPPPLTPLAPLTPPPSLFRASFAGASSAPAASQLLQQLRGAAGGADSGSHSDFAPKAKAGPSGGAVNWADQIKADVTSNKVFVYMKVRAAARAVCCRRRRAAPSRKGAERSRLLSAAHGG